jgi:general secretion pathway protein K
MTMQSSASPRRRQQGAALLMAMVIVTLVATISASMVWQQWRAVQVEGAERVRSQASWVLSGALDWARLILREDGRNGGPDHLGEVWATPLAEARLSSFLAADTNNTAADESDTPEAFLSGKVDDATAKYNLNRLIGPDGAVDEKERAVLRRLCEFASLSPSLADGIAQAMSQAAMAIRTDNPDVLAKMGGEQARAQAPLIPQTVDQLLWLGLDAATLERLRPYVTLLPTDGNASTVNVNTAPKEVIAAVVDGLDLARAARIVQARQRNPFKDIGELNTLLGQAVPEWHFERLDTKSEYFEVKGRLRYEDNVIEQRHLVRRVSGSNEVMVLQQSRFSGIDAANGSVPPP